MMNDKAEWSGSNAWIKLCCMNGCETRKTKSVACKDHNNENERLEFDSDADAATHSSSISETTTRKEQWTKTMQDNTAKIMENKAITHKHTWFECKHSIAQLSGDFDQRCTRWSLHNTNKQTNAIQWRSEKKRHAQMYTTQTKTRQNKVNKNLLQRQIMGIKRFPNFADHTRQLSKLHNKKNQHLACCHNNTRSHSLHHLLMHSKPIVHLKVCLRFGFVSICPCVHFLVLFFMFWNCRCWGAK